MLNVYSSSGAAPKIVPSNFPVLVKSAGALEALRSTAIRVDDIVRLPDAPVKRPVPPPI
jgi:ribosome-associated protein YbcJ (S4-like RNA binding protein)